MFRLQNLTTLVLLILLTLALRFPSFFEPYWYGDELIRLLVAREWFAGTALYSEIFDNSPPALYLIFGLAKSIFRLKVIAAVFAIIAVIAFNWLSKTLAKNFKLKKAYPILATILFIVLISTPIFEGNIAQGEIFALAPVIFAMVLIWKIGSKNKILASLAAGVLFATASLVRMQSATDLLAGVLFLAFFKNLTAGVFSLAAFLVIWILVLAIFFLTGNLQSAISAIFLGNFDYVNYANQLFFPFGLLAIKILVVVTALLFIFKLRRKLTKFEIFLAVWLTLSFFGASIGGRGFPHYLLQITPAASLIAPLALEKKRQDLLKVFGLILAFTIFFVLQGFDLPRFFSYYSNFVKSLNNPENYKSWFSRLVTESETISNYISTKTGKNEKILVLGNLPQIYLLSERHPESKYVVVYHLNFQKNAKVETLKSLSQNPPKIVVVYPEGAVELPQILPFLSKYYYPSLEIGSGQIWERGF